MQKNCMIKITVLKITFSARVIVENIIPRNMIINLFCASVYNHILRGDIFDYHPRRECNIYKILMGDFKMLQKSKQHAYIFVVLVYD